jgi:hypothetical protein
VARHGPEDLLHHLGAGFELVARRAEDHTTPSGAHQAFTWVAVRATLPV